MAYVKQNRKFREYTQPDIQYKKRSRRKNYKSKKKTPRTVKQIMARIRLLIFSLAAMAFISPAITDSIWNDLLISRIKNASLNYKIDRHFFNQSEKPFLNSTIFGTQFIGKINTKKPIMQSMYYGEELGGLKGKLEKIASKYSSITPGVFVWDYLTGDYVSIKGNREFATASIIKIPILCQLFRRIEKGLLDTDETIEMKNHYRTGGSGLLQYSQNNTEYDINHLAKIMIQNSDNSATNMILSAIGGSNELNRNIRNWGFSQTYMKNWLPDLYGGNVSTPIDIATMLYNIDNPEFLTLPSRAKIIDIMSNVKNRYLIQKGLPDDVQFIHKTGDIGNMLGDAGIVIMPSGRKYIVVIMAERPWNHFAAKNFIIEASETIYKAFKNNSF